MKGIIKGWRKFLKGIKSWEDGLKSLRSDQRVFVSHQRFRSFKNVKQFPSRAHSLKPSGLWYSCGSSWVSWLQSEIPGALDDENYLYEVKLGDGVLKISASEDFDRFQSEFGITTKYGADLIDWERVAQMYSGIEICPLNWEKRNEMFWYNGWDAASGCIWNSSGVSGIVLLAEREDTE